MASQFEKTITKAIKNMPNDVSLDSFKNLKNEPMLNLLYKVLKKKDSFTKVDLFDKNYSDIDFKRPFIFDFEYDYFSVLSSSTIHWDLIYQNLNDKIYFSKSNFIPNSKVFTNSTNLMIQRIVDCSLEAFCFSFFGLKVKEKILRNSTQIQVVKKVNPEDVKEENPDLKMNNIPSFILNNDKYSTFPIKMARKITCVESVKLNDFGTKVIGLSRPYLGDLNDISEFEEKLKFKVVIDSKSEKEIEVEGIRAPQVQFTEVEKINENQIKLSFIQIIDPKMIIPGKTGFKMVINLLGKFIFKKLDELHSELPKHFSMSDITIDEQKDPIVATLKNLFFEQYKKE